MTERKQAKCPTCGSHIRKIRNPECIGSQPNAWHGESGPAEPRVFQQTNCPKCRHRFTVEVLGVESRMTPLRPKLLSDHDAKEIEMFMDYCADQHRMEPAAFYRKWYQYMGLSDAELEAILAKLEKAR